MADDIIDFKFEKAKRKSGITDTALIKDMLDNGYDPCNSIDGVNYFNEQEFNSMVQNMETPGSIQNWSDESIKRLFRDIMASDPENIQTETVSYTFDSNDSYTFNTDDYN